MRKIENEKPIDERIKTRFEVDHKKGLNTEQVAKRVEEGNTNYTHRGSTKTYANILLSNLFTFFNILCFAVAGALIYIGFAFPEDGGGAFTDLFFMVIILSNITIGIYTEIKAKLIIEKLSVVASSKVKTIRNGEETMIMIDDVVLDDIVVLSNGQQIPADSVIMDGVVEVNEALLTGESVPIQKKKGDTILAGSFIVSGTCYARACMVGPDNYISQLVKGASKYVRPRSELLKTLKLVIKVIACIIVPLSIIMLITQMGLADRGILIGGVAEAVRGTAGAIIGMIPAGMFLLTSVALAVGVINLKRTNTLVQELYCIEMLARVDTLCLDKTGTITDGTMNVCEVIELKNPSTYSIREIMSSMLWALDDNNQTSIALGNYFDRNGVIKATQILPFSSSRKLSAVTFEKEGTFIIGAPEFILKDGFERIHEKISKLASQGYRVLVLAHADASIKNDRLPAKVKPVAIITIQDNVRAEAPATIQWFKDNGVDVRVISGDNPVTVSEVAKRAGINNAEKYISLDGLSDNEVRASVKEYTVFGRVTPEQKFIIIKELKNHGRTVAMTGDGVNDILALREADCSIAMATGSEAARNVSHLVLLDSNFASMPKVVSEGRRVVNNVQKSSSLFLFKTMFSMMLAVFVIFAGISYIFTPVNLNMMEFFIIGIPSTALALQLNNQKIQGRFIFNILKASFAGAFVVAMYIILLHIFNVNGMLDVNDTVFTTMCIFIVTGVGFMMLYKLCKPLNAYRSVLLLLMLTLIVLWTVYLGGMTGIVSLSDMNILLLITMIGLSYPIISFLNEVLSRIKLDITEDIDIKA